MSINRWHGRRPPPAGLIKDRFVLVAGTALSGTTAIAEVGATGIAPQQGLVDQAAEHTDADIVAQPEQSLRLGQRQAQPWHLALLDLDSPQEFHPRREIPAIPMTIIVRVRQDPPGQRTNAEWSSRALRQLRANGIDRSSHLRHGNLLSTGRTRRASP
jgi:hypothetical protein